MTSTTHMNGLALNRVVTHFVSDCDGVLIDSEAVALDALLDAMAHLVSDRARLAAHIRPRLGQQLEPLLVAVFPELGLALPGEPELAGIRAMVEAECDRRLSAVPGVAQALAAIPLPKAVASNSSNVRVHEALERTGLAPLFGGRIFTADIVSHPKPHPAVYLAAAAGFGVPAAQCVAVEDSVTGVTAAAAAGMVVLGFIGGGHITEGQAQRLLDAGAHACFDDMAALPGLVAQLS